MTIPNHQWLTRSQPIDYASTDIPKPPTPLVNPVVERLGPIGLNDSRGQLINRWWACWQDGSNVVIAGAAGADYGAPVTLFQEVGVIEQITLTFDQLGRPLVFYKLDDNSLKLYWFDPVLGENTISVIGQGNYPTAFFDFPQRTGEQFTDAIIVYIGTDTQVKWREQRDRFNIERGIPDAFGSRIVSAGMTRENRVQIVYR